MRSIAAWIIVVFFNKLIYLLVFILKRYPYVSEVKGSVDKKKYRDSSAYFV